MADKVRVLRHGSEVEINADEFNPASDQRLPVPGAPSTSQPGGTAPSTQPSAPGSTPAKSSTSGAPNPTTKRG